MYARASKILNNRFAKVGVALAPALGLVGAASASADNAIPPWYPWEHRARFTSYDHGSMRRGWQVYKEVCAACHPLERICYRHLIGITHTAEQAKIEAKNVLIDDIDDQGNNIQRPGRLTDGVPNPYPNENAGRAANNGAYPPDLSLMAKARDGGADYIFALLCGYGREIPAGMTLLPGQHFNPWFGGGAIGMPQPIYDDHVQYEDGTPATIPQMAKDISEFLTWCGEPHADTKKMWFFQALGALTVMSLVTTWATRYTWNVVKTAKYTYKGPGPRPYD